MNHHLSTDLLVDFIHGELPPEDDALAHAHLAVCADCRATHERELAFGDALRRAANAEEREMPSLVAATVWQQVRDAKPGPLGRLRSWLQPLIAVPVAALLLVGGLFAAPHIHPAPSAPTIDATYYLEAHAARADETPLSERTGPQMLETSSAENAYQPRLVQEADVVYPATFDAVR